jgi:hypothetical protein
MKTTKEWFQELPDGIRELALANQVDNEMEESLTQALLGSFCWGESPEGDSFWAKVYHASRGHGEYPKIPQATKTPKDPIVESVTNPFHYKSDNDVIKFCMDNNIGFCEGNVIKYVRRWKEKNGVEDLLKAREYIDRLISDNNPIN